MINDDQYNQNFVNMFGVNFFKCTLASATEAIIKLAKEGKRCLVVTPNVDCIMIRKKDLELYNIYKRAALITADGMPLVWLSRLLPGNNNLSERVTGADMLLSVCALAVSQKLTVGFIGGGYGVAENAKKKLIELNPGLEVIITHCPPFGFEHNIDQTQEIIDLCRMGKPDILFFGVGCPKQEKWCDKYLDELDVGPVLCVGAAFDFAAGNISRAPDWLCASGLEWLYRLIQEPRRLWKRYLLRDSLFMYYVTIELLSAWINQWRQKKN